MKPGRCSYLIVSFLLLVWGNASGGIFYPLYKLNPPKKQQFSIKQPAKIEKPQIPRLTLSAVIASKKEKFALINGYYLKEGDKIGSCIVKKILTSPPSVILSCKGVKVKLKINLTD